MTKCIFQCIYRNLNHNQLSGDITDIFSNLPSLTTVDLSSNSLTGNLPQSFSSLPSLKTLYLQNNQLTGSINVLANLPLDDLNVANNRFTGWIPDELKKINSLQTDGNSWSTSPAQHHHHHHLHLHILAAAVGKAQASIPMEVTTQVPVEALA